MKRKTQGKAESTMKQLGESVLKEQEKYISFAGRIFEPRNLARMALEYIPLGQLDLSLDKIPDKKSFKQFDEWAKKLHPDFNSWDDFTNRTLKEFTFSDILRIPPAFFLELPSINTFDQLVNLIRKRIEREKPYSINIAHPFMGKPKKIDSYETKNPATMKIEQFTNVIYERGTLKIKLPKENKEFSGLTPFTHQFLDYCIVNMADDGSVPVLLNKEQIYDDFGISKGGKQSRSIDNALKILSSVKIDLDIELPLERDSGKIELFIPDPELFLTPIYARYTKDGQEKVSKKPVRYILPSFVIGLKKNWKYKIYRDKKYFKILNAERYFIMEYLHGMFRMNLYKDDFSRNILSICNGINWNLTINIRNRDLPRLHTQLDFLRSQGVYKNLYVTEKKTGKELSLDWFKDRKYKLINTVQGKKAINSDVLEKIIYHFVPTNDFIKEHIRGEKPTKQLELKI